VGPLEESEDDIHKLAFLSIHLYVAGHAWPTASATHRTALTSRVATIRCARAGEGS